jgi:hypothetical protein
VLVCGFTLSIGFLDLLDERLHPRLRWTAWRHHRRLLLNRSG